LYDGRSLPQQQWNVSIYKKRKLWEGQGELHISAYEGKWNSIQNAFDDEPQNLGTRANINLKTFHSNIYIGAMKI
jgi:hypothetical protein